MMESAFEQVAVAPMWFTPLIAALVGALTGSIVGGLITHLNSRYIAERQEQRQINSEEAKAKSERLGIAYSIAFKVHTATEVLRQLRLHALRARLLATRHQCDIWQTMEEFMGAERERLQFTSTELSTFAINRDADFVNDLQEFAALHNILVDLFKEYNPKRESFGEKAVTLGTVKMTGKVASFETSSPMAVLLSTRLSQLAHGIEKNACEGLEVILKVANGTTPKLHAMLKDPRYNVNFAYEAVQFEAPQLPA